MHVVHALRRGVSVVVAVALTAIGLTILAPPASAATMNLQPIVAANSANDFATNTLSTIVITGTDMPVAPRDDIGIASGAGIGNKAHFVQVSSSAGWRAGVGTGRCFWSLCAPPYCYVVIGASSATELVLGVGNVGATCFNHINAGETITVKLFDTDEKEITGTTVSGTAIASGGAIPVVNSVKPPYGPDSGGNPADTATNGVVVDTASSAAPEAFWFGGYQIGVGWYGVATTQITPKGNGQFTVVPPAFVSGKAGVQNYGVSVFAADAANGLSNQLCNVLITGCADEYLYVHRSTFSIPEQDLSQFSFEKTKEFGGGTASPACGLALGMTNGVGASVGIKAGLAGKAKLDAEVNLSYSNAKIPEAVIGEATLTVSEPIVFSVTLTAKVQGCVEIPFPPPLNIQNVVGLYVVIGGSIEGSITLSVTIAKGTYGFTGGWVPSVEGRDDTGGFGKPNVRCVDANDNPTKDCISTKVEAGVKGTLSVTPLWLQLGPNTGPLQANVGVGLTAAGVIQAQFQTPPWPPAGQVQWDICASLHWAAHVALALPAPLSNFEKSWGGPSNNLLGPYNIVGDGSLCPLGPTVGAAATASTSKSTTAAAPGSVPADGTTTSTVTVTLKDAGGAPLVGKAVTLDQGGKSSVISAPSGLSDSNGVVTFTVKSSMVEAVTYAATNTTDNVAITNKATVTFGAAGTPPSEGSNSTVSAEPGSVPANGATTATVKVTLKDGAGAPLAGKTVSLDQGGKSSVISAPSGASDANGVVTFTVKHATPEAVTYTAKNTIDNVTITQTATVTFTAASVSARESDVAVAPAAVPADGTTTSTVTVTLKDEGGAPVAGKTVSLAQGGGKSVISAASGESGATGVVTFTVKNSTAETVTYTATDTTDNVVLDQTRDIVFGAGAPSASKTTVSVEPAKVPANGKTDATVTVAVRDAAGRPVTDKTVTLAQGAGTSSVIGDPSGPSDDNGTVTFSVTDTVLETATYTATVDGVEMTQKPTVTFADASVSDSDSFVSASPGSVPNDGVTISTITVTVVDDGGEPVAGKVVTLKQGVNGGGSSSVISPASGPSGADGIVTFTVTNTVAESVAYTAFDVTDNVTLTQADVVNFGVGPSPSKSTVTASPRAVAADGVTKATVTVTIVDNGGVPMEGRAVSLAQGASNKSVISTASGLSDVKGVVTFTVTDGTAENVTYTATDEIDSVVLADTAKVSFGGGAPLVSLEPARILESRARSATVDGLSNGIGLRPAGSVTEVQVAGRAGVPVDAAAAVLNVTVDDARGDGYLTVFPCGSPQPNASNVNYYEGETIPNAVFAKIGVGGKVCIYTFAATELLVDVNAFFPAGASFGSLQPARILESRPRSATVDGQSNGIGVRPAGSVTEVQVTGRAGVPADAAAVVLNVTVDDPGDNGYLTVFPCGSPQPNASNVNYYEGETIPNAVVAKLGVGGKVCIYTFAATHLLVDVNGYFPPGASFGSLEPARLLESRLKSATVDGQSNGIGVRPAGSVTEVQVTGRAGVPAAAAAVVLNVTVDDPGDDGFLTVFPCGSPRPNASNVNYFEGETIPNAVVAKLGVGGKVCIYTFAATDLLVDVNGYFPE
jgi:hypothetical protein